MFCEKLFSFLSELSNHARISHKTLMNLQIKCNIGTCTYHKFQLLLKHIRSEHSDIIQKDCITKNFKNSERKMLLLQDNKRECNSINMHDSDSKSSNNLTKRKNDINFKKFQHNIMFFATKFIAKLYSENNTNRETSHEIIFSINTFFFSICLNQLPSKYEQQADLCRKIEVMKKSLQVFKTKHMTLKFFRDNSFLFMPKKIIIASSLSLRKCKQTIQLLTKKTNIVTISLNLVLKKFLEMPHVFDKIISFIRCTDCFVIKSITQDTIWKSQEINTENIKIPLTLFFDDVEVNNPLGSHKSLNKIGTVYCTVSCLPLECASMLKNIFLLLIHKYTDHKCFGNERIFHNNVKQLTDLENGSTINVCGKEYTIFFYLTYTGWAILIHPRK